MSRRSLTQVGLVLALLGILLSWGTPSQAAPPPMSRDDIICRAASAVGFSYHWGGACWCANGCSPNFNCSKGSCSGNCGNCTHSGTYGADCSGLAAHTWQVPSAIAVTHCDHGPYGASAFSVNGTYWDVISRSALQAGDTLACSHHVVIFQQGDPWGSLRTYEARGCSYGIVHNWRTCTSDYHAARRHNLISSCECTPGESQTGGCGNCGTHSRTCAANCHWGAWSGCSGQGECAAGSTDSVACCDCGHRSRTCSAHCAWGAFGECGGPDPAGPPVACDTGEPGLCADGTIRCVKGCLGCASTYTPVPEICDDLDNDCSGVADDGDPVVMGDPPPAFAARLFDVSVPSYLDPDERSVAWAGFVNEGTHPWAHGQVLLVASLAQDNQGSQLYDEPSWPAWDVAAVLDRDVLPGQSGYLTWMVHAPLERGEAIEQFRLAGPDGTPMRCPATAVALDVHVGGEPEPAAAAPTPAASDGCSCRLGGSSPAGNGLGAIGLFAAGAILRRRRPRASRK